ncbi:TLR4 regulator/MIR-interacting MSAP protein [Arabidopsis thaliana]|uniref:TLR4 regulator/MIR-interacting MSAP protein n=1 Tax=Arabidopsis thaliana TaxID=3702 RepID=F4I9G7_ARATH|nr:TLR4 regulator/MIR-interacting MSAP protein [Arabidopsis thaliana]AEE31922.1 TLR4 regulator/MIR-interacting MSAP protein [Arabidopsis thaliana]|eukprot:NP_001154397.1 TLR4 regulator/MIR-interacting MSAP protein [Arabidopsis thaliana]
MAKLVLFTAVIIAIFSHGSSVDDKCAACNAVAEELELQLLKASVKERSLITGAMTKGKESDRLTLLRVISDLRVVDLLDGLCDRMQDYTLQKVEPKNRQWVKVGNFDNLTNKQEAKAHANDISTYCGRLLEETEDELGEVIKNGSLKAGEVRKVLCQTLSNHCRQSSETDSEDEEDDDADEL